MTDIYAYFELATFNAEVARGIVHTAAWKTRMAMQQRAFDAGQPEPPVIYCGCGGTCHLAEAPCSIDCLAHQDLFATP